MFGFLFVCLPPSNLSLVFSFGLFQFFFSGFGWLSFVVLKRKKRDGFGFWGCFGGCGGICLSFLLGSSSLFWFSFEKQCDQTVWVMVMCWVVWTDTKAEKWPEKKKNKIKPLGLLTLWEEGEKKGEKKILVPIVAFHWGQKAWVALLNKAQHFWDVWTRCRLGVVWGRFLSVAFLSVVVTFDCIHDDVWITCKSVLCVNFIFPLCQDDPGRPVGHFVPFPFPLSCPFAVVSICLFWGSKAQSALPGFQLLC